MATYRARLSAEPDGSWIASSVQLPHCWSRGTTRDEAMAKLRDEIRYRIELCPCSGVDDAYVQVELQGDEPAGAPQRARGAQARPPAAALSGVAGCPPERPRRPPCGAGPEEASRPRGGPGWRRWDD